MTDPLPSNVFVAIATVLAALIAGLISVVALTLTKEQKTSEFRQAWIDGLRSDLSDYLASARAMARAIEELHAFGDRYSTHPFTMRPEQLGEMRLRVAIALYRIKLRLNPDEADHNELLRLLLRITEEEAKYMETAQASSVKMLQAIEIAAEFARPVLKAEWKRVKSGEPQFRHVRNGLVPAVFVLCALFAWFILRTKIAA